LEIVEKARKYNIVKKITIPILLLAFFLAPISPVLKNNNGNLTAGVGINKAEVVDKTLDFVYKKNILLYVNLTAFLAHARTAVFL